MIFTPSQIIALNKAVSWWKSIRPYFSRQESKFVNLPSHLQHFTILGQAGTGKTSICKHIIDSLDGLNSSRVLYMTPTGKAATVLRKKGIKATTIHSGLLTPRTAIRHISFRSPNQEKVLGSLDEKENITISKTSPFFKIINFKKTPHLIVVDEAGMVGSRMEEDLRHLKCPILCMGDPHQLPPVKDMMSSFFMSNTTLLTEITRQSLDSPIVYLANRAINGLALEYGRYGDSEVSPPSKLDNLLEWDMIVACRRSTVRQINSQCRLEKFGKPTPVSLTDKVMCLENHFKTCSEKFQDYPKRMFSLTNGTCGEITRLETIYVNRLRILEMDFVSDYGPKFKRILLDPSEIDGSNSHKDFQPFVRDPYHRVPFSYAYCCTVHKLQGSEYPRMAALMYDNFGDMENRQKILYTAITRASKAIKILV